MKTRSIIFFALIAVSLASCVSASFYQVYKVTPFENLITTDNYMVYEDENCKVSYNLWEEGGNIGFRFYNKTDKNIYLNLNESFFILNGISNNYYKNRVYENSTSSGVTSSHIATASKAVIGINYEDLLQTNRIQATSGIGLITSSGNSISYIEEKVICIPSKASKIITEYNINKSLYRDCDLYKFPTNNKIRSKSFSKSESPIVFSNRIAYTVGQSDNLINFENIFYVTEITNYPESEMIYLKYDDFCGERSMIMTKYFKNVSPDKFYIRYTKEQNSLKH
ncbi:MAG: hypothetical protein WCQ70_07155 [Lentimicrobiaceae bacterium]